MMEDHEQNENRPASARIHPKIFDVVLISSVFLVSIVILTIGRWNILQKKQYFIAFSFLVCCIPVYVCLFRRVSVDSRKLKYYILGLIPVEVYWYDVAQIGIVHVYRSSGHVLLGEMFVIVLKPCQKYEEGFRELRWWHIHPKWRHPFLVKNIYCDTGKYKEIIEEYSHKKVSFEIEYS